MDDPSENPFDITALAMGDNFFGREDEMSGLLKGIQEQAQLLLFGGEGMGKSSLLENAGTILAQRNQGWMIRIDLSLHQNLGEVAGALQNATDQLSHSSGVPQRLGVLGDRGKAPVREGAKSGVPSTSRSPSSDLVGALGRLNAVALRSNRSIAVAFDACHEMGRFGAEQFEAALMASVETHSAMSHILCGNEHGLRTHSSEGMRTLLGAFSGEKLAPLEPHSFAQWIDARFQSAGTVSRGVGAACVDLGGPNTAQTVELAQRSFDLSLRARFANEATVQTALNQMVSAKNEVFDGIWKGLSAPERSVMQTVAKGGGRGLLEPNAFQRCGLRSDEQARSAIHSLVEKRLLDPAGPAGMRIQSAAMKRWTLQAHLSLGREQRQSGLSAQQLTFSLSFQQNTAITKSKSIGH